MTQTTPSSVDAMREALEAYASFGAEVAGTCLGLAMSTDHPSPDEALMGLSEKAQELAPRARAALSTLPSDGVTIPAGWVLVPREPIEAMLRAYSPGKEFDDLLRAIYRAMVAAAPKVPPVAQAEGVEREIVEAECAALLAAYLRKEIGRLMQQAEHWAANDKPLAVHHRLMKADNYFQILALMEREPAKGCRLPFDEIRDSLKRPSIYEPGAYPPSADLYRYRDPAFVVAALTQPPETTPVSGDEVERVALALLNDDRARNGWPAADALSHLADHDADAYRSSARAAIVALAQLPGDEVEAAAARLIDQSDEPSWMGGNYPARMNYWRDKAIEVANRLRAANEGRIV